MTLIEKAGNEYTLTSLNKALMNIEQALFPPSSFFHYHAAVSGIRGWLRPREAKWLFDQAKNCMTEGSIVEVGSAWGKSTICMGLGLLHGGTGHIYAVDPHIGGLGFQQQLGDQKESFSSLDGFRKNIERFGLDQYVTAVVAKSEEAVAEWGGEPIRLLFVDGWHTYEAAKHDILAWGAFVISGGKIAVHDYSTAPDVGQAVHDAMETLGIPQHGLHFVSKNLVYFEKR